MTKILLAIEESDFTSTAVDAVRRQFRPEKAEICLLHVTDAAIYLPFYGGAVQDFDRIEEFREETMKAAQVFTEQTAKQLRDAGYRVETAVEEGEPRTTIVDYAEGIKADLIVVGSHGRRGLPRILLGSVSEYVARHAPCSVEIVRPVPRAA
jgi:nucleotide-binding universal stress UspA family protein